MLQQTLDFYISFFENPSALGIGLAIIFGAIWLVCYWPPIFKKPWLWVIMITSAILTLIAVSFIQLPLQIWIGEFMTDRWTQETLMNWILLAGIPAILLSGLVQEGAKLVPVVIYWWRNDKRIDPKLGLIIGAVAGTGFGIFETQWIHNIVLASGWNWSAVQADGLIALAPFWERFFGTAFHIAACAFAGYGLARGWGWQFYLLASLLHFILNFSVLLLQSGILSIGQVELYIAIWSILVVAGVLWIRWKIPPAESNP